MYIYHSYSILYIYIFNRATIYSLAYFLLRPETDAQKTVNDKTGLGLWREDFLFDTKWVTVINIWYSYPLSLANYIYIHTRIFQPSLASTLVSSIYIYIYTYINYKCVIYHWGFLGYPSRDFYETTESIQLPSGYLLHSHGKAMENHHFSVR